MWTWYLSGTVARRLRRSVREVADSAEAVTRGRFDVRAPEHDDELGRLAHAFNRMTARLEAADARQREFLADVAHELRTPVTAIDGFATALSDGTARTDEARDEAVAFIRAETDRLRDLVRDLQTLTWLDLDPPCAAVPVDLAAAARTTVARVGPDARARGVSLTGPDGELWATADPDHVDTILANLTANALNAAPTGGSIALRTVAEPSRVGVAVHDTGRGIAPEHLPYVFDRLYRAESGRPRGPGDGRRIGHRPLHRAAAQHAPGRPRRRDERPGRRDHVHHVAPTGAPARQLEPAAGQPRPETEGGRTRVIGGAPAILIGA